MDFAMREDNWLYRPLERVPPRRQKRSLRELLREWIDGFRPGAPEEGGSQKKRGGRDGRRADRKTK